MGDYLREAPLIVLADVTFLGEPQFQYDLVIRKIVSQTKQPTEVKVGDILHYLISSTAAHFLPRDAKNVAVVFAPDWRHNEWPIAEVYQKPEQISALRQLLQIYALPSERAQLSALLKLEKDENPVYASELLADFRRMREPANIDLVIYSFEGFDNERKANLLSFLGEMNDLRTVPLLISALKSTDRSIKLTALNTLTTYFPGAPGLAPAFAALLQDPIAKDSAWAYLNTRAPKLVEGIDPPVLTPEQKIHALLREQKPDAAWKDFQTLVENEKQLTSNSIYAAQALIPNLNQEQKKRLGEVIDTYLPSYLKRKPLSSWEASVVVQVLRSLPQPHNVDWLISLMYEANEPEYSSWTDVTRAVTFELHNMGAEARSKGAATVLRKMKIRLKPDDKTRFNEEWLYFCQLAWLANDATWRSALAQLPENLADEMKTLSPIHEAVMSQNEASALAALLPEKVGGARWQGDSEDWIITRLGELKDPIAIEPLFQQLEQFPFNGDGAEIEAALISIGGPDVEKAAQLRLSNKEVSTLQSALRVLSAVQGERVLPLLRKLVTEPNQQGASDPLKTEAIKLLGTKGTPDDLPLLAPLANFWNRQGPTYWSTSSMAEIRSRYHYNINGPMEADIQK